MKRHINCLEHLKRLVEIRKEYKGDDEAVRIIDRTIDLVLADCITMGLTEEANTILAGA